MYLDLDAEWELLPNIDKGSKTERYAYFLNRHFPFGHIHGPFGGDDGHGTDIYYRVFVNLGIFGVKYQQDVYSSLEDAKSVMEKLVDQRVYDLGLA